MLSLKVVVTGAGGQLGRELSAGYPSGIELYAFSFKELDVSDHVDVLQEIKAIKPDVIVNAAAYTNVDLAESKQAVAHAVNCNGAGYLAEAALHNGSRLVHISTDFVFDGGRCRPYLPTDRPNPLGAYGVSKLAGEMRIAELLDDSLIIRTSWLYSAYGRNFVKTMLRLMQERRELKVVSDQIGVPTWGAELAKGIWLSVEKGLAGIQHWSDSGVASWYDFAVAVQEEAFALGLLTRKAEIRPIRTKDYPTPAQRPLYSVLDRQTMIDSLGYTPPHWRVNLRKMLRGLKVRDNE